MENTQSSLLERLRNSPDDNSWKRLIDLYTPFLERVLRAQGIDDNDANDLLQDVFMVVVQELPNFKHSGRTGAFRNWLRSILSFRVRRHWQKKSNQPESISSDSTLQPLNNIADSASALEQLWDQEHNRWLTNRLLEMIEPEFKPSTWQAFLRLVVNLSKPSDVADELGLSVNAVLIAKSRILRRLRQELAGLVDDV